MPSPGRVTFVAVDPASASEPLDPAARAAIDAADRVRVDPEVSLSLSGAVPAARPDVESLVADARAGLRVVRIVPARPTFDDASRTELTALAEASIPFTAIPAASAAALPLAGVRVLVTRASDQAGETARALRLRGAVPIELPTIVIGPPDDGAPLARAARALGGYDVVAITSANGVRALFDAVRDAGLDARALAGTIVAAIGPGTAAALERRGVRPDLVADDHRGEGLASAILERLRRERDPVGARVLLPRAAVARSALPDTLAAAGVTVDVVEAYRTRAPERAVVERLESTLGSGSIDAIAFTASSTVENLFALVPDARERLRSTIVASIGPITSATCRARGLDVTVEANPYTIPALIAALEAHVARSRV